jgi:hypothetical protein
MVEIGMELELDLTKLNSFAKKLDLWSFIHVEVPKKKIEELRDRLKPPSRPVFIPLHLNTESATKPSMEPPKEHVKPVKKRKLSNASNPQPNSKVSRCKGNPKRICHRKKEKSHFKKEGV